MRKNPLEEGLRWLRQASEDLHWAHHLAEQGAYHLACFLAQQVAEMAQKAFLFGQGKEIVLGHSGAYWMATTSPPAIPMGCPMAYPPMSIPTRPLRRLSVWQKRLSSL
jgi:hypothetical protein